MQIFSGLDQAKAVLSGGAMTIGNFDGVHLGHRHLIARTVVRAKEVGGPCVLLTFDPHPLRVLRPELPFVQLFDRQDQQEQFRQLGVDALVIEPFSRAFSQVEPESFLEDFLLRPLRPRFLVVGHDFSFGQDRRGSIAFLENARQNSGAFGLEVVHPLALNIAKEEVTISSTRIRQALARGQVEVAGQLLGRAYSLRGLVKKGAGRGRALGIPTANIESTVAPPLALGVYGATAEVNGRALWAVVNVGRVPTFSNESEVSVEVHFPDGIASLTERTDLYGEKLTVSFLHHLREEIRFPSVNALLAQIKQDIEAARLWRHALQN